MMISPTIRRNKDLHNAVLCPKFRCNGLLLVDVRKLDAGPKLLSDLCLVVATTEPLASDATHVAKLVLDKLQSYADT